MAEYAIISTRLSTARQARKQEAALLIFPFFGPFQACLSRFFVVGYS